MHWLLADFILWNQNIFIQENVPEIFHANRNTYSVINSLAPGRCSDFKKCHFQAHLRLISSIWEITPMWMLQSFTNEQSILIQIMSWSCQAPSHYQNQHSLTLSIWFTCPLGMWLLKIYMPSKTCHMPSHIYTSPAKLMYTAEKISTCPDWTRAMLNDEIPSAA